MMIFLRFEQETACNNTLAKGGLIMHGFLHFTSFLKKVKDSPSNGENFTADSFFKVNEIYR